MRGSRVTQLGKTAQKRKENTTCDVPSKRPKKEPRKCMKTFKKMSLPGMKTKKSSIAARKSERIQGRNTNVKFDAQVDEEMLDSTEKVMKVEAKEATKINSTTEEEAGKALQTQKGSHWTSEHEDIHKEPRHEKPCHSQSEEKQDEAVQEDEANDLKEATQEMTCQSKDKPDEVVQSVALDSTEKAENVEKAMQETTCQSQQKADEGDQDAESMDRTETAEFSEEAMQETKCQNEEKEKEGVPEVESITEKSEKQEATQETTCKSKEKLDESIQKIESVDTTEKAENLEAAMQETTCQQPREENEVAKTGNRGKTHEATKKPGVHKCNLLE